MARCQGVKARGEPCERIVPDDSTYCYAHDPANAEQRSAIARKAGKVRKPATEITEVKNRLRHIAEGVLDGTIEKGRGSVAIQAYGVMVRAVETTRRIHETEEIVARIEDLEHERERETAASGGGLIRGG